MSEIRKLTKTEIAQAEMLASGLAESLETICSKEGIDNFGVVSTTFLILITSLIGECFDEDEQEDVADSFCKHIKNVICDPDFSQPQVN